MLEQEPWLFPRWTLATNTAASVFAPPATFMDTVQQTTAVSQSGTTCYVCNLWPGRGDDGICYECSYCMVFVEGFVHCAYARWVIIHHAGADIAQIVSSFFVLDLTDCSLRMFRESRWWKDVSC